MNSHVTNKFRKAFAELPADICKQARNSFKLFINNPNHPSLRFKLIYPARLIYSVRIALHNRAVGVREEDVIIWFWIGSHTEYEKLIHTLDKKKG